MDASELNTMGAEVVWPLECPFGFETLNCNEIAQRHKDCIDPECIVCQFHEALRCTEG